MATQLLRKYLDIITENTQGLLDASQMTQGLQFRPTAKQDLTYRPHGSPVNSQTVDTMKPFTYAAVSEPFTLTTVTSRGQETQQPVEQGFIIISGPSAEKYYNKPDKFRKNYPVDKGNGAVGPDTKDQRQVAQYQGPAGTYVPSYGGTSTVFPGDYLVRDTPLAPDNAPFYSVAQQEFERTYVVPR